jgi:hypothetical protein
MIEVFKHTPISISIVKMLVCKIWLISKTGRRDETFSFHREADTGLFKIVYCPCDLDSRPQYTFKMTLSEIRNYIETLMDSLRIDKEPWNEIQVSPVTSPTILYDLMDFDSSYEIIMETIETALMTQVTLTQLTDTN